MNLYLFETYCTFIGIFMFGWIVYIALILIGCIMLSDLKRHKYIASMRYYFIIVVCVLLLIGILGSIFLPSPEVMKLLLGV